MDSCRAWHETDAIQPLSQLRKGMKGIVSAVAVAVSPETLTEMFGGPESE